MPELRVVWRMATWYQCAIMLAFAALFGWIVRTGLRSTSPDVYGRVLAPAYGLWLYATLAALVNRRSVVATPERLVKANGPIPLGVGTQRIPREEIAFCYHAAVITVGDAGDTVVLWHVAGVETRAGHDVPLFDTFADVDAARAAAQRVSEGLGSPGGYRVPVRQIGERRDDPADRARVRRWLWVTGAALAAGVAWEVAARWGG